MTNPPDQCLVTWPTTPTQGDVLAPASPHHCALSTDHIHDSFDVEEEVWGPDDRLLSATRRTVTAPHVCHCGDVLPVRDVEEAA